MLLLLLLLVLLSLLLSLFVDNSGRVGVTCMIVLHVTIPDLEL